MSNYTVMLVDDEEDVIQAIMKKIKWDELGFEVAGYAHNGLEALELAQETLPDVVMTDIKMPYMDGLELASHLKEQYPTIKIIIFSGFDEFEYAKEAIRLEAEEYILKPIDSEELSCIFTRIKESLDQEIAAKRDIQKLQNYYMDNLPMLQENFYKALVEGQLIGRSIDDYISDYKIELKGPLYATAVIHAGNDNIPDNFSPVMLAISLKRIAEEKIEKEWDAKIFTYHEDIILIVSLSSEDITRFTDECDRFCRTVRRILNAVITVGIGRPVDKIADIPKSYKGARDAVSYRAVFGSGHAINITEIAPCDGDATDIDEKELLKKLFQQILVGSEQSVEGIADYYIANGFNGRDSSEQYNLLIMELLSELYRFANRNQLDSAAIFGDMSDTYAKVSQMRDFQLREWFIKMCKRLQADIQSERKSSAESFIKSAVEYSQANFDDPDLGIDKICSILGVSSTYFSTLFERETGKNYITFLTDYRMKKAMEYLTDTDDKTYVIAEKVGYLDVNYFSYVFKKQYGTTPNKFRSMLRDSNEEDI